MADLTAVRALARAHLSANLDPGWSFVFDHARRRAGLCNYATKTISLSRPIAALASIDDCEQTILHEVAHALAGHAVGHGAAWREKARALGYTGGRTSPSNVDERLAPWVGRCAAGHTFYRYRRPTSANSCSRCHRGFSRAHLIEWHHRPTASNTPFGRLGSASTQK